MTQEEIKAFWKEMWELKIKIFGVPTKEDIIDASEIGTLPLGTYTITDGRGNTLWFVNAEQL